MYNWSAQPNTRLEVALMDCLVAPLDHLTYAWFGHRERPVTLHDVICEDGIVDRCQKQLMRMLDTWRAAGPSNEWHVFDYVCAGARQHCGEVHRKYMRRNLVIFAAGVYRRQEQVSASMPHSLHAAYCERCTPDAARRHELLEALSRTRPCCMPSFAQRFFGLFSTAEELQSQLARDVVVSREASLKRSTKVSEGTHARGHRILGSGRKQMNLASFARRAFLAQIRTSHAAGGGNGQWQKHDHKQLLQISRQEEALTAERQKLPLPEPVITAEDTAVVAFEDVPAGAPEGRMEEIRTGVAVKATCGHLNPLLLAINMRLQAAKALKGSKLTHHEVFEARRLCTEQYYGNIEKKHELMQECQE